MEGASHSPEGLECSYIDAESSWPGFEGDDFEITPTSSALASHLSLPTDDLEGPLLDALARLHREQVRNERLEAALDASRALSGLANSGRPDRAASALQAATRGLLVRRAVARANKLRQDRGACQLQRVCKVFIARRKHREDCARVIQTAFGRYLQFLSKTTKTALRRELLHVNAAKRELASVLQRKDAALERLIDRQVDVLRERQAENDPLPKAGVSTVPVPVSMSRDRSRDVAARLHEAKDLMHRLEIEKKDLARMLHEQLDINASLAEEASALQIAKEVAEDTASKLLAEQLRNVP